MDQIKRKINDWINELNYEQVSHQYTWIKSGISESIKEHGNQMKKQIRERISESKKE